MIVEIPSTACSGGSRFASEIAEARKAFESRFTASNSFRRAMVPVEVRGIGFFDFIHGQQGVAPNGIELHPVIYISFNPFFLPRPPPSVAARRRAARTGFGLSVCNLPSFTLTASRSTVCSGQQFTLSWQSSDALATVSIDGIGTFLASSGSTVVNLSASSAYSGRAANSCGTSHEGVAVVTLQGGASASLTGPSFLQQGNSAALSFSVSGTSSWTLSSSLGNSITPSSGTSGGTSTASYGATRSGTDMVTLNGTGGACGSISRTITITIGAPPLPPPPPPPTGGLLCCDGTRSPTCFNCSSKQGCCSSHRGVCGCP